MALTTTTKAIIGGTAAVVTAAAITAGVVSSGSSSSTKFFWCIRPSDNGVVATKYNSAPACKAPNFVISTNVDVGSPTTTTTVAAPPTSVLPATTTSSSTPTTIAPTTTTNAQTGSAAPTTPPALICGNPTYLTNPSSTAPPGAVVIPAGNNPNLALDYVYAPDTTYWFAPGVHTIGLGQYDQIAPKGGDVFIGAPGAILDGQNANRTAFGGNAANITIKYLEIRNFIAYNDQGVVNHDYGASWTMSNLYAHDNKGAAVLIGPQGSLKDSCLDHNGQYGFQAGSNGFVVGADVVLDHNEISRNDADLIQNCGCEGGGKFWYVWKAQVTNNYVHNNNSVGIWADTNNVGFNVEGNYISDNFAEGFFYEISYNARIVNNTFIRNANGKGPFNPGFPASAVYLSESGGDSRVNAGLYATTEISGNVFTDNWSGVVLWENADRYCSSPSNSSTGTCTLVNPGVASLSTCAGSFTNTSPLYFDCRWRTQNVSVHDNLFTLNPANVPQCTTAKGCGFQALMSSSGSTWTPYSGQPIPNAITFSQNNVFKNNTYKGPWAFKPFDQATTKTFAQWQAAPYSQDAGSTLSP